MHPTWCHNNLQQPVAAAAITVSCQPWWVMWIACRWGRLSKQRKRYSTGCAGIWVVAPPSLGWNALWRSCFMGTSFQSASIRMRWIMAFRNIHRCASDSTVVVESRSSEVPVFGLRSSCFPLVSLNWQMVRFNWGEVFNSLSHWPDIEVIQDSFGIRRYQWPIK